MTSYYEHLAHEAKWNADKAQWLMKAYLKEGDIFTWGTQQYSARVISNDETGLIIETYFGSIDYWSPDKFPLGIRILPDAVKPESLCE